MESLTPVSEPMEVSYSRQDSDTPISTSGVHTVISRVFKVIYLVS